MASVPGGGVTGTGSEVTVGDHQRTQRLKTFPPSDNKPLDGDPHSFGHLLTPNHESSEKREEHVLSPSLSELKESS